eukprot:Pompholyxophrys_punicea_v1_NODE_358_length_2166_cov_13.459498.p1 type:complete len:587 gc:universal NODE_358_length_2166_cov_13.459498:2017-257(-)
MTWKFLNNLRGKPARTASLPESLNIDETLISSPLAVASHLNDFFATRGALRSPPADLSETLQVSPALTPSLLPPKCTANDVKSLIQTLKGSTLDHLGVHTSFLRDGADYLAEPLAFLINLSLSTSTFPDSLKVAKITPLFKKGARDDPTNYRPISVLPLLSKLFEKFVDNCLRAHLDLHKLWDPNQFGFRKGYNTLMALIRLYEMTIMNVSEKQYGLGLFLDIKQAFDSVSHCLLLKKLPRYGITGTLFNWFVSYLENRKQWIQSPDGPTPLARVLAGVPQGSVLGPILFNIFVNDLPSVLVKLQPSLFADDTGLFNFAQTLPELLNPCFRDLEEVALWYARNGLLPNADKSSSLLFASPAFLRSHRLPSPLPEIPFNGSLLSYAPTVKFLGIYFNSSLSWSNHVDALMKKLNPFSGILYFLRTSLPSPALLSLYHALILPVWGSSDPTSTALKPIFLFQKRLVRLISRTHYRAHTPPLFKALQILPIFSLCHYKRCLLVHKLLNNDSLHVKYGLPPFTMAAHVHQHLTRRSSSRHLFVPRMPSRSLFSQLVREWSTLPLHLRAEESLVKFKKALKAHIIEQVFEA